MQTVKMGKVGTRGAQPLNSKTLSMYVVLKESILVALVLLHSVRYFLVGLCSGSSSVLVYLLLDLLVLVPQWAKVVSHRRPPGPASKPTIYYQLRGPSLSYPVYVGTWP